MNLNELDAFRGNEYICDMEKEQRKSIPELNYLLSEVQRHYGRRLATSADFEALSVVIEHESGELLSSSTLKRLWGYVTLKPTPRPSTLDVLCRYIGKKDFHTFCKEIRDSGQFESRFFSARMIVSSDLETGAVVVIGWAPDRLVQLRYEGDDEFTVVTSENSKLMAGDRFTATCFALGYPLFLPKILRNGEYTPSYIAGADKGLNRVELV